MYQGHSMIAGATMKILIGALALVALAWFKSCREIKYTLWGETAQAQVDQHTPAARMRGRESINMRVGYSFYDDETEVSGSGSFLHPIDRARTDWPIGKELTVVYVSGDPKANTPVAERSLVWPGILLLAFAAVGWFGWQAWRQAAEDVARDRAAGRG